MKKAVLYARVSSAMQEKERTIESQIVELKKQIAKAGNVLVKEYTDNGYSGAQLDRPALDQLRKDLKTNLFDTIYFLNTDRIAREVTYQTIIIAEILKYKKQIIINGQDYVHNPENKFSLTVLGAVAELERAKIIERLTRGQQHHLRKGLLLGQGHNIYGLNYIKKTPDSPAMYTVNEQEAATVRHIFEMYAKGNIGLHQITKHLEETDTPRKAGGKYWNTSQVKYMLKNESYTGMKYFNTKRYVREYANPLHDIKHSSTKLIHRPREEWIGIKIPRVIPQKLFEKVRARFEWNKSHYRNPKRVQLLSNLIVCGECGSFFFAYQRYYRDKRSKTPDKIHHKFAYKCNWRHHHMMHSNKSNIKRCYNKEIKSELLESHVFRVIKEIMLDPAKLHACVEHLKDKKKTTQLKMEKELKDTQHKIRQFGEEKRRILDLYASGGLDKNAYAQKSLWYDNEINKIKIERCELIKRIPILHKKEVIDVSIRQYCELMKARLEKCNDFDTKRQFLLDHIEKVIYANDSVNLYGSIPVKLEAYNDPDQPSEASKIGFSIESRISRQELLENRDLSGRR